MVEEEADVEVKGTKMTSCRVESLLMVLSLCYILVLPASCYRKTPPLPILPLPTAFQLQWQLGGMALFFHFGTNTFTDSEWGTGHVNPNTFNPTKFNASQWIRVAKDSGFSRVILTAKHHDGFCLWPSDYTNYSVRSSNWKNGNGDVMAELAAAAKQAGIGLGIYLSPWDRHEACYGDSLQYNEFYLAQITELLTRYGEIKDVFLDGAKESGEKDMKYFFESWMSLIHQLQPGAIIFSDLGPDTRWVGNEYGSAGSTCWSPYNTTGFQIGHIDSLYNNEGDPFGPDWIPATCDVSIRSGWFWHASQHPKSARSLLEIYYKSVGRNCQLLLNVPPNSSGLISDEDIQVLQEFTQLRKSIFSYNLAINAVINASSIRGGIQETHFSPYNVLEEGIYTYWAPEGNQSKWILFLDLQELVSFNVLQLQEPIHMGQRVFEFHLEALSQDGAWMRVVKGTTIGYRRLLLFPKVKSKYLRLVVDKSRAEPLISYLGIYMDPVTISSDLAPKRSGACFNGSQVLRTATNNSYVSVTM